MNDQLAIETVRECLAEIKPDADLTGIANDTPLLAERVISSFDVLDLILHLEQATGRRIERSQMLPGCFRDIATIANVFVKGRPAS